VSVVVVGAGPAGLHAASTAARCGASVLLVDAGAAAGGQYHRHALGDPPPRAVAQHWHPRIDHRVDTTVWAIDGRRLFLRTGPADSSDGRSWQVDADALVLATGAYDRALPFPGWDLPGVVTAGAAQALAKAHRIAVGQRVIVAGSGPFLLPVATSLLGVGARVVAVLEAGSTTAWRRQPVAAARMPEKLAELTRYAATLARARVPYRTRRAVVAAHGRDRVAEVTVAALDARWRPIRGRTRRVSVDAVCVGYGFLPQLDLALSAGARLREGFVEVDAEQATSVAGVFAAGEITGLGGADLAAAEGELAGYAAAAYVGRWSPVPARIKRRRARLRRFATALSEVYAVQPGWQHWLADDTVVCRCEEIAVQAVRRAVAEGGADGLRALRLTTRAGLGLCQGRVCLRNVADLAEAAMVGPLLDYAPRRAVAFPIRLAELADSSWEAP
jgi:NADPH-dependent 2,4-dienoyl-CoA reductase/sulfur reductase-like enzyme